MDLDVLQQELFKEAKQFQKLLTNLLVEEKNIMASIAKVEKIKKDKKRNRHCIMN